MQVSEMVREAVDRAVRQLTANGGGTPQEATTYQHAARTAEEIKATVASGTVVPRNQAAVTDGMDADLAEIVNSTPEPEGEPEPIFPKEGLRGWKF